MAFRHFALAELGALRKRGQKPEDPIVVGDKSAGEWARKNRFFFVPVFDLDGDLSPFAGLNVIARMSRPGTHREALQRLALTADVVVVSDPYAHTVEVMAA